MRIRYNMLWYPILEKKMNKTDLKWNTGISTTPIIKLGKSESITTDFLVKICRSLSCKLKDAMELSYEDEDYQVDRRGQNHGKN